MRLGKECRTPPLVNVKNHFVGPIQLREQCD